MFIKSLIYLILLSQFISFSQGISCYVCTDCVLVDERHIMDCEQLRPNYYTACERHQYKLEGNLYQINRTCGNHSYDYCQYPPNTPLETCFCSKELCNYKYEFALNPEDYTIQPIDMTTQSASIHCYRCEGCLKVSKADVFDCGAYGDIGAISCATEITPDYVVKRYCSRVNASNGCQVLESGSEVCLCDKWECNGEEVIPSGGDADDLECLQCEDCAIPNDKLIATRCGGVTDFYKTCVTITRENGQVDRGCSYLEWNDCRIDGKGDEHCFCADKGCKAEVLNERGTTSQPLFSAASQSVFHYKHILILFFVFKAF